VVIASCIHYVIVAAVLAAQLTLNYSSFADVCVTIRIYINFPRQSNLQLEGPSFLELWGPLNHEALGRLPTPPKAKAGTETNYTTLTPSIHPTIKLRTQPNYKPRCTEL